MSDLGERLELLAERDALAALLQEAGEVLMSAWGLIANAWEGRWEDAPQMWHDAAISYREEEWHPFLHKIAHSAADPRESEQP